MTKFHKLLAEARYEQVRLHDLAWRYQRRARALRQEAEVAYGGMGGVYDAVVKACNEAEMAAREAGAATYKGPLAALCGIAGVESKRGKGRP